MRQTDGHVVSCRRIRLCPWLCPKRRWGTRWFRRNVWRRTTAISCSPTRVCMILFRGGARLAQSRWRWNRWRWRRLRRWGGPVYRPRRPFLRHIPKHVAHLVDLLHGMHLEITTPSNPHLGKQRSKEHIRFKQRPELQYSTLYVGTRCAQQRRWRTSLRSLWMFIFNVSASVCPLSVKVLSSNPVPV